jgi:hypothetical protein
MFSFTKQSIHILGFGATVLAAGVYYQTFASQQLDVANLAMTRIESAQARAYMTKNQVGQYVNLLASMTSNEADRQEPFAVASEFTPQEINRLAPLLDTLYHRDGHFFLQHFQLSWNDISDQDGHLPSVELELDGRKVLLFSDQAIESLSLATAAR